MRKTLFVLIIALLLVLVGCQQTDNTVSDTDTTAPPIVIVTETQEVVTGTEQTSSTEEPKKTESNTSYEETDIASDSAETHHCSGGYDIHYQFHPQMFKKA